MHRPLIAIVLALGLAMAGPGCADPDERSTTIEYLHATIIEPSCATATCHSASNAAGGPTQKELDLSTPEQFCCELVGMMCPSDDDGGDWVTGPAPQPLVMMLDGRGTQIPGRGEAEEAQMPPDQPLAPGELALIQQWIDEGALCE